MAGRGAGLAVLGIAMMAASAAAVPLVGKGAKRTVKLFVDNTSCAYDVEAKPVRLEKAKQGALGWRFQNDCNVGGKSLLCVYDAQGKLTNPFEACTSVPPGLDVAAPFALTPGGGKAEIDCVGKNEGNYLAVVLVGDDIKGTGCPATPPKEKIGAMGDRTFTHRLAVEIVP